MDDRGPVLQARPDPAASVRVSPLGRPRSRESKAELPVASRPGHKRSRATLHVLTACPHKGPIFPARWADPALQAYGRSAVRTA